MHNKEMINTIKDKLEISKKLKERAIYEGFTIAGIASIPGSSRLKLRTSALERWLSNNHHADMRWMEAERTVSYTHLTLPTKRIV